MSTQSTLEPAAMPIPAHRHQAQAQVQTTQPPSTASTSAGRSQAPEYWIRLINEDVTSSVRWAVQTGHHLTHAKKELGHGRWSAMFGPGKLRIGLRKAEMLMEIARHPSMRQTKNFAYLPASWSTLHVLSKVPAEIVDAGIASGSIHPKLTLAAARRLAEAHRPGAPPFGATKVDDSFDPFQRQARLLAYLRREAAGWPTDIRPQLAQVLKQFADDLVNDGPDSGANHPAGLGRSPAAPVNSR